jgi:hypothetical protein
VPPALGDCYSAKALSRQRNRMTNLWLCSIRRVAKPKLMILLTMVRNAAST